MESIILLMIIIAGLGFMTRFLTPRAAFNLLMLTIFATLLLSFITAYIKNAPQWFTLLIIIVGILLMLQFILGLLFGKHTAASAVGHIISELILLPFRLLIEILRGLLFRRRG
jgi:prepilin signal peptidase PulO-like enzyme (type II secretory pathway)